MLNRQLDIFEFLQPHQENRELKYDKVVKYLETMNDEDLNIIFYGGIYNHLYLDDFVNIAIQIKKTKTYHFANLNKDIYIYSYFNDEHYYRCYQVGNRILVDNIHAKQFNDDVYFPAMCLKMLDLNGNPIHFSNREDFIMNDLGFNIIGTIRSDIFKHRDFATVKATWEELTNFLKE